MPKNPGCGFRRSGFRREAEPGPPLGRAFRDALAGIVEEHFKVQVRHVTALDESDQR